MGNVTIQKVMYLTEKKPKKQVINKKTNLIIIVTLTILSISSIYLLYNANNIPSEETETKTNYEYVMIGSFDYKAKLKENILYNKTTLKPGEGKLYLPIIDYLNLTFRFTFLSPNGIKASNTTILPLYEISTPNTWKKTYNDPQNKSYRDNYLSIILNFTEIDKIAKIIDEETGLRTLQYNFTVTPTVYIELHDQDLIKY